MVSNESLNFVLSESVNFLMIFKEKKLHKLQVIMVTFKLVKF